LLAQEPREAIGLAETLAGAMRDGAVDLILRQACADFLAFLGSQTGLRVPVVRILRSFAGTDLELKSTAVLERIENSL
jgi:hypothetical protein